MVFNNSIARFSIGLFVFIFMEIVFVQTITGLQIFVIVSRPTHRMMLKKIAYHHCQR